MGQAGLELGSPNTEKTGFSETEPETRHTQRHRWVDAVESDPELLSLVQAWHNLDSAARADIIERIFAYVDEVQAVDSPGQPPAG